MPNFDGGHYFYTGLAPIARQPVPRADDGTMTAPSHIVREVLAWLPNFSQVKGVTRTSPFARCLTTHFARFAVIDDPAYNGRDPTDALKVAVKGIDLLIPQPIDHLKRPWLLFEADFDAADGADAARDAWAADLWAHMSSELCAVFAHCIGFEAVTDGAGFAAYLARAQIETWMSFNDYGLANVTLPTLSLKRIGLEILVVLAVFLGLGWLVHRYVGGGWPVWLAAGLLGLGAGLWAAYRLIMRRGAVPYPTAPDSDLKSVLKGLYLQQNFTRFAIDHQGDGPERLHAAFGAFLAEHRPTDLERPTQVPGVLRS